MLPLMLKVFLVLNVLALIPAVSHAQGKNSVTCAELGKLLSQPGGTAQYELLPAQGPDGNSRIQGIDLDSDGVAEDINWSCPGSGSRIPADPCILSIKLSSGPEINFEESRFVLMKYRSRVYAVAAKIGPNQKTATRSIYRVSRSGVSLICPKL